jgi:hypothetical protein
MRVTISYPVNTFHNQTSLHGRGKAEPDASIHLYNLACTLTDKALNKRWRKAMTPGKSQGVYVVLGCLFEFIVREPHLALPLGPQFFIFRPNQRPATQAKYLQSEACARLPICRILVYDAKHSQQNSCLHFKPRSNYLSAQHISKPRSVEQEQTYRSCGRSRRFCGYSRRKMRRGTSL